MHGMRFAGGIDHTEPDSLAHIVGQPFGVGPGLSIETVSLFERRTLGRGCCSWLPRRRRRTDPFEMLADYEDPLVGRGASGRVNDKCASQVGLHGQIACRWRKG